MYYYIKYSITNPITNIVSKTDCVSNKHPFDWLKFFDSFSSSWNLIAWKEITIDEYKKGISTVGIG